MKSVFRLAADNPKHRKTMLQIMRIAKSMIWYRKNWTQMTTYDVTSNGTHRYCAVGAVQNACSYVSDYDKAMYAALVMALDGYAQVYLMANGSIIGVNDRDNKRRAHREVMRAFSWLIRELEEPAPSLTPEISDLSFIKEREDKQVERMVLSPQLQGG